MNEHTHSEHEHQLQLRAEQAERAQLAAGADSRVDQYRLVMRALRQPLPAVLADDFSVQVMQRIRSRERRNAREDVVVTGLLLLLAALGLVLAYPYLLDGIGQLRVSVPVADGLLALLQGWIGQVPWAMLAVAAVGIGVALTLERLLSRASPRMA